MEEDETAGFDPCTPNFMDWWYETHPQDWPLGTAHGCYNPWMSHTPELRAEFSECVRRYHDRKAKVGKTFKIKSVVSAAFGWAMCALEDEVFLDDVDDWWAAELERPGFTPRMALAMVEEIIREGGLGNVLDR